MANAEFPGFQPSLFEFLEELADHNNRPWFQANRARYEELVREPSLAFIRAFRPRLARISRYFLASDRRVGGSLIRVYRDTRFSRDKTPYKTNVGIQFRHQAGRDIHAPGFYVHVAPDRCFLAAGVWRPDRESLGMIRREIAQHGPRWRRAKGDRRFGQYFELVGDSLKRPPRGFPPGHPLLEDLKRKDFLGFRSVSEKEVLDPGFLESVAEAFTAARPLMRFLCRALRLAF